MRLVFMGTPESALPSLRRCIDDGHEVVAVWTQPDRPAGRGKKVTPTPIKQFATERGLRVYDLATLKSAEAAEIFASHEAEIAVVVAYGRILPRNFLDAPRFGCLNVHFSLLPKYRGAAPVNWAIINGERKAGVTTMRMDVGLDTGDILLQQSITIGERETAPELMRRLSEIGAELLGQTLESFPSLEARPQNANEATLAPMLRKQDGLIDWSRDAFEIERRIRGFQPWPNAYTNYRSRRLIILSARAALSAEPPARAGTILEASRERLVVGCGAGTSLSALEIKLEGKRAMNVLDFLNGSTLRVGDRFDS